MLNVVLPFLCLSYAVQTMTAGSLSIINAMVPMFGGIIAWAWLRERLSWGRVLGLAIGFAGIVVRSEEHTSELQSLMRISYAVFCLKKKNNKIQHYIFDNRKLTKETQYKHIIS